MGPNHFLALLTLVKIYAVEVCGTLVFVVFVIVEAVRAIHHIVNPKKRRRLVRRTFAQSQAGRHSDD